MMREIYSVLIFGTIMVASSFCIYHFANAQINLSDSGVRSDNFQPLTPASVMNNALGNRNDTQSNGSVIENATNWTVVSGNWTILNDNLLGGSSENKPYSLSNNIVLNTGAPQNVTSVSTSFEVNNLNTTVPNYASIIFSFVDLDNFRKVGINILNNSVYAIGYTMNNGTLVSEPFWPGVQTNLTYTPGAIYNLTMVNQNWSLDFFINGTKYLSQSIGEDQFDLGEIGLSYGRIKDVSFVEYDTQNYTNPDSFAVSDTETVLLEDETLPADSYIHLYDSTPYQIISGHIATKLPCNEDSTTVIDVLVGQAPYFAPIELEYIPSLSVPSQVCLYHGDINFSGPNSITDIVVWNNSPEDIDFPDTSSFIVSVTEISHIR